MNKINPIEMIQRVIQLNLSLNQPYSSQLKKETIDSIVTLEQNLSQLDFTQSDISELEFFSMLEILLEETRNKLLQMKKRYRLHKNDLDFILSVLRGLNKNITRLIEFLDEDILIIE